MRLVILFLLLSTIVSKSFGCTMFTASNDSLVLVGNNIDYWDPYTKIWFNPPENEKYGCIFFGFENDGIQGGMNSKGLNVVSTSTNKREIEWDKNKIDSYDNFASFILENCSSLKETIEMTKKYNFTLLDKGGQYMITDTSGQAIVYEGDTIICNVENKYIIPSICLSRFSDFSFNDAYQQRRFDILKDKISDLENEFRSNKISVSNCKGYLSSISQDYTQYSKICDLKNRRITLYHFHNFVDEVVIDFDKEIAKGKREINISELFNTTYAYRDYVFELEEKRIRELKELETKHKDKEIYHNYSNDNPKTPKEVILTAYFLANKGEYDKATSYLSSEVQNKLSKGFYKMVGGAKGGWDYGTKKRTLKEIRVYHDEINDKKAKVISLFTFEDGKKRETTDDLVFEDGHWKID